nr:hypothetical protein [Tanacetum cinerariifolium]
DGPDEHRIGVRGIVGGDVEERMHPVHGVEVGRAARLVQPPRLFGLALQVQRDAGVAFVPVGLRFDDAPARQLAVEASENVLAQ